MLTFVVTFVYTGCEVTTTIRLMQNPRKNVAYLFVVFALAGGVAWQYLRTNQNDASLNEAIASTDLTQLEAARPVAPPSTNNDNDTQEPAAPRPVEPPAPSPLPAPVKAAPTTAAPVSHTHAIATPYSPQYQTHQPVNLRDGQSVRNAVITTLPHGAPVTVIGHASNRWVQVRTDNGQTGYVWYEYVR